ncbi:MAG: hypothetical protein ACI35R_11970 [Bacillus sp. (in: firmicutes)]
MRDYLVVYTFAGGKELERTITAEDMTEMKSIVFSDVVVEFDTTDAYYRFSLDDCVLVSITESKEVTE